jgi:hypothetical protein
LRVEDYSLADKVLHYLALGVPLISKASFDFDGFLTSDENHHSDASHIFVSGLARAGTTKLMRAFYATGHLRSLTYRDMPFVLMPGTWRRLSRPFRRSKAAQQRAHGDGIYIDFDSPEAFEEVFWRIFCGQDYIFEDCLRPHAASNEVVVQFRRYVSRITLSSDRTVRRYLSKNNNNVLRLGVIRKAFPNALILIPFRDPIQQAASLLRQHQKFSQNRRDSRFITAYMQWLGHHEFGPTHKPLRVENETEDPRQYDADNINYWLAQWTAIYQYLFKTAACATAFVCFEDLCESPREVLTALFDLARLPNASSESFNAPPASSPHGIDGALRARAVRVYEDLRDRSRRWSM